jgi:soluble lytic murein transglycosylase-like protein
MDDLLTFDKLVEALIRRESSGRSDAISDGGAVGLMGIMPEDFMQSPRRNVPSIFDVARTAGFSIEKEDETKDMAIQLLKDPELNMAVGRPYLRELMDVFDNDTEGSLTAYNAGVKGYVDAGSSAANMGTREAREYSSKLSKDYENLFGSPLPANLGTLTSPRPRRRPRGLLD